MAALKARFVARCEGDLARLRILTTEGQPDVAETRMLVHGLAGAGATFGFPDVSTTAGRVDDAYVDGRPPSQADIASLIDALEAVVTRPS
ncbi:MAG TPA: Hpt domain-containing protein [Brevundimonas sp.]|nr:Hpt domain-containing protein [Brevundimonas sp.]